MNYILINKKPVLEPDILKWGRWHQNVDNRRVNNSTIGDANVSTVFLGLDHGTRNGEVLLFETMIFGGEHDQEQWRYATWEEAQEGHKEAVKLIN